MADWMSLPYRLNVGAVVFGPDGRVLVGRRAHVADAAWQLPQGGIDAGEDPRAAVFRELEEEIGTANAEILAEHPEWIEYDLPEHLIGKSFKGRFRGQRQKWFALKFLGQDSDVVLDAHTHPEFDAWKWVELAELPGLAVSFKRPIYEVLARDFAPYARPEF
ncbi:MAG TPA: RNA pyrophosphohydrolase [Acidocella sp.]|nr:RNA pyrophosphohydrolase [Acidocella sp.]